MIMAMKESGIEWVGLIPDTWSVIPNKYVMHKEKNLCEKWTGEDVMSLTMNGVIVRDLQNPTGKMPATFDGYQYIEDGDLLMCLFDIDVTPRCVGKVMHDGVTSPAYSNFKIHDNASRDYFYYYYLMVDNTKELLHLAKNLRHSFTEEQLGQLKIPMPPLFEQQAIADYLDETCSKIDEIIAEAKASIDEYKELKQSVIFEAVTKGLDKNVKMKDSGVEWIGNIPSSWQLRKLKTFTVMISKGTTPKDMSNVKTALYCVRYLKSENIKNNHLDIVPEFYITEETHNELSRSKLNCNDILFVIAGASIGKVAIMDENLLPANTNQANAFIRIKDEFMDSIEYLWMLLQSVIVKEVINRYSVQSAQPNISMENLGNIKLPYPLSKRERNNIMNYLREKIDAIDFLIAEKESLINELEAYKKSLIYEVVTGKRRVV
ncbi:restriction endonuclease subunit S [Lachnospiraceae bacterium OF09-6]|nr:restriction endonuclease subunit S [Lachnospiraceae bacterium OF09-6]